jgi:hypothetical protein
MRLSFVLEGGAARIGLGSGLAAHRPGAGVEEHEAIVAFARRTASCLFRLHEHNGLSTAN